MTNTQPLAESPRLGRVHTIRIPEPIWDIETQRSSAEQRRDGVSEIARELMEADARAFLAEHGIHVEERKPITQQHAERLYKKLWPGER